MTNRRYAEGAPRHAAPRTPKSTSLKKGLAGLSAAALVTGGLVLVSTVAHAAEPINGSVFIDYDGDGEFTASGDVVDALMGGVTVTAYDESGVAVGSTTSMPEALADAGGNYILELDGSVETGDPIRLEFTGLPHGLGDSFDAGRSSVRFITAGEASSVDYGVFDPVTYIPSNVDATEVPLFAAIQSAGLPGGDASSQAAVVGTPWQVTPNPVTSSPSAMSERRVFATYGEVGSVWGLAYNAPQRSLYAAATYKRFSALGSLGLGGIYRINGVMGDDGRMAATGTSVEPWLDVVDDLGIDVGTVLSNVDRGLTNSATEALPDSDAFAQAGKVGIGGVAVTADGSHLIFVNLHDRDLYVVDLPENGSKPSPTDVTRLPFSDELADGQQPWAVTIDRGTVYVGYVDTGETPGASAKSAGLNAYVVSAGLDDVLAGAAEWQSALTADLGYKKGNSVDMWGTGDLVGPGNTNHMQVVRWNTWADEWSWDGNSAPTTSNSGVAPDELHTGTVNSVGLDNGGDNQWYTWVHAYPQGVLSGIAIDSQGYMTLGFTDRTAIQSGNRNLPAIAGRSELFTTLSGGDLLLAAPNIDSTGQLDGTFTLENDGTAGDRTCSDDHSSMNDPHHRANDQGPGGDLTKEFYDDNQSAYDFMESVARNDKHHYETALGAVVAYPGREEVASTAFDPTRMVNVHGVSWFNTTTGNGYQGYNHTTGSASSFMKGGGMGGLSLALKAAPVQVGNRAWLDLDADGIQTAGEPGIVGAKVSLYRADANGDPVGDVLASTTTDDNGEYFFRTEDAPTDGTPGFTRDGAYVVVFEASTGAVQLNWGGATPTIGDVTWNQLLFTEAQADDGTDQTTQRDSNARPVVVSGEEPATRANAFIAVGGPGQNDHSIDAGWKLGTVTVGDYVWEDSSRDGVQDDGEPGIEGVLLKIERVSGDSREELRTDVFGDEFTENRTDADGRYLFENLPVLVEGEHYEVSIVRDDVRTSEALALFEPTQENGTGRDGDSSKWTATTLDTENPTRLTVPGSEDLSLDFGFVRVTPSAVILKGDDSDPANVAPADTPDSAVDLTVSGDDAGSTSLLFEISNDGGEDLYDVVVTDVSTGSGDVEDLICYFPGGDETAGVFDESTRTWTVTWEASRAAAGDDRRALSRGASFDCKATLTGVIGDHENVATIDGTGAISGDSIPRKPFDPTNPETPGTDNPFHATRTPSVSVGDRVWWDTDADGIQGRDGDGIYTEPGIDGVVLKITGPDGQPVHSVVTGEVIPEQTTENGGEYEFIDLPVLEDGRYTVTVVSVPEKFTPTEPGTDNGADEFDSSTDSAETQLDLSSHGKKDPTLDFGFVLKTPGATVNKSDADGNDANTAADAVDLGPADGRTTIVFTIENDGEEPLTNIGLGDASSGSGTVDYPMDCIALIDGEEISFSLASADARWNGELPVGATITCEAALSGVTAGDPHADVVTLFADGVLTGLPVQDPDNPGTPENPNRPSDPYHAEKLTYAIGDVVWIDRNQNGQQDRVGAEGGEKPMADVVVNLLDGSGAAVKDASGRDVTTTTDGNGRYLFDDLVAGDYIVEFVLPDGYRFTEQNSDGVLPGADSDADPTNGRTDVIVVGNDSVTSEYTDQDWNATEGVDPRWDAGIVPESVSVGDFVWQDLTGDGIQDSGEPGIPGATLTITGPDGWDGRNVYGEPVTPVETDGRGLYEFTDLPVLSEGETYTVTISDVPAKFKPTLENQGERGTDSSTGSATSGALTEDGASDPTLDFGFVLKTPGASVNKSDVEGRDADDPADPADLSSTDGAIDVVFTVFNNGEEPITNIGLADVTTTGSGAVSYPLLCSATDGDEAPSEFSLERADARWSGELGIGETISCTGVLTGVAAHEPHTDVVTLWADGALTGKTIVDPENPGTPEDPNRPSDPYNAVVKTYAIGDYVWLDQAHPNGIQDADEPGVPDVTVVLRDTDGTEVARTTTDGEGHYSFDELKPGDYRVDFTLPRGYILIPENTGDDSTVDSDAIADDAKRTSGSTVLVTLDDTNTALTDRRGITATEGIDPTWDAGVRRAEVSVGDRVWKDKDRDGIQDDPTDEPGIPGVTVVIERTDGEPVVDVDGNPVDPAITGKDGEYRFDRLPLLPAGETYVVRIDREKSENALDNLVPTLPGAGEDPAADSSDWEERARGLDEDGDEDTTLDFGFVTKRVTVGDRVWEDKDKNGRQDPGEPGIPGVVLTISGPDGEVVTDVFGEPVGPQTTDEQGEYLFDNLPALHDGEAYKVTIDRDASADALKGLLPTREGVGDRERDSSTWEAVSRALLTDGDDDLTLDFGFVLEADAPLPLALAITGGMAPIMIGLGGVGLLLMSAILLGVGYRRSVRSA
ncbi:SdrD B-like domain-containing protein [Microbacterium soli]|uniref:SD-repeat containing protein B domain-containing protein n=1 Tax=Microbacterium soli TaxID=446075 RepID=A0ABP7MPT4_9MICO